MAPRLSLLGIILVVMACLQLVAGCGNHPSDSKSRVVTSKPQADAEGSSGQFSTLGEETAPLAIVADKADFVGSQACAQCHQGIAETYKSTHSMSRSMSPLGSETLVEDYENNSFSPTKSRTYEVNVQDGEYFHREQIHDAQGEVVFETTQQIQYALGSGRRGRSYLLERDGLLFQSPISWYSQLGKWDLAPGYSPGDHMRFDRRIQAGCLFCHAGRIEVADHGNSRMADSFLLEGGIGCERCHGAGRQHIENQRAGVTDLAIVNPAKLPTSGQRDSVCLQCHLRSEFVYERKGRRFSDFQPGLHYEDAMIAFVRPDDDSVVQQFRSSKCFLQSNGKLGCISCHEPHSRPSAVERAGFYRKKCLQCHQEDACSLPQNEQQAQPAAGSCVHCHMPPMPTSDIPHTALTNHTIGRRPTSKQPATPAFPPDNLELFRTRGSQLPQTAIDRGLGLINSTRAAASSNPRYSHNALAALQLSGLSAPEVLEKVGRDVPLLERLGIPFLLLDRMEITQAIWHRAIELQPSSERTLRMLVRFHINSRDPQSAIRFSQQLIELNPYMPEFHWTNAQVLDHLGRSAEAIKSVEACLKLDPGKIIIRQWLAEAYRRQGEPSRAAEQADLIQRATGGQ